MNNPFANITEDDMIQYAGKVIAVCMEEGVNFGKILASSDTRRSVEEIMDQEYPEIKYGSLCLPELEYADEIC